MNGTEENSESFLPLKVNTKNIFHWTENDVSQWLIRSDETALLPIIKEERMDGKSLLALNEDDVRDLRTKYRSIRLGDWKHFWIAVRGIQKENHLCLVNLGLAENNSLSNYGHHHQHHHSSIHNHMHQCSCCSDVSGINDYERISPPLSIDGRSTNIQPEVFKAMISLGKLDFNFDFYFLGILFP